VVFLLRNVWSGVVAGHGKGGMVLCCFFFYAFALDEHPSALDEGMASMK
jgi:hypothetical protein